MPQHYPFPGFAHINGELLGGELRSPEKICVVHKHYRYKARRCAQCGRIAEISPKGFTQTNPSFIFTLYPFLFALFSPLTIFQRPDEHDAEKTPYRAKRDEHAAPGTEKTEQPRNRQPGYHKPHIQSSLMDRERKRAGLLVMHRNERVGAGRIEAFADAGGNRTEEERTPETADEAHAYGHQRPRDQRKRYQPLAGTAVAHKPGDDGHGGKRPGKRRIDPSDLNIGKPDILLDRNRKKTEESSVRLVEEERTAQHGYQQPFICLLFTHISSFKNPRLPACAGSCTRHRM